MPAPVAEPPPQITIIDTVVGRRPGGHQADYLAALEEALEPTGADTFAPFRDGANAGLLSSRWKRLKFLLCRFRLLVKPKPAAGRAVLLVPNPDFIDFVSAFLAVKLRWRSPAAQFLFVMRRSASGIVGRPGWKCRALEKAVRSLARSGHLHLVSDSRSALTAWETLTGTIGSLVTIPVRERPADLPVKSAADPVVFGLAGLFRPEKGAPYYGQVVDAVLSQSGPTRIDVQLPDTSENDLFPDAAELRARYGKNNAVRFLNGHLDNETFTRLVSGIDVLILPYDAESYGTGTSGIMHEVLALGGTVVTTRFAWAMDAFGDHPNVFWLDDLSAENLANRMTLASDRALQIRTGNDTGDLPGPNSFRDSWLNAIEIAD